MLRSQGQLASSAGLCMDATELGWHCGNELLMLVAVEGLINDARGASLKCSEMASVVCVSVCAQRFWSLYRPAPGNSDWYRCSLLQKEGETCFRKLFWSILIALIDFLICVAWRYFLVPVQSKTFRYLVPVQSQKTAQFSFSAKKKNRKISATFVRELRASFPNVNLILLKSCNKKWPCSNGAL